MGPENMCLLLQHCSGPGGIRTLDLFSAIEARSQLRYRPLFKGSRILPVPQMIVKELASVVRGWLYPNSYFRIVLFVPFIHY
jgi:hypothetical protein